jgi:hypothetical protein
MHNRSSINGHEQAIQVAELSRGSLLRLGLLDPLKRANHSRCQNTIQKLTIAVGRLGWNSKTRFSRPYPASEASATKYGGVD